MTGRIWRFSALALAIAAACTDVAPTAPSVEALRPLLNVAGDPSGTRSFCNEAVIRVPSLSSTTGAGPADIFPSTLEVSGITSADFKVTARLNAVSHTFVGDLDVLLVSPAGIPVMLLSDATGLTNVDFRSTTLTFDDDARDFVTAHPSGVIPSGTYRPTYVGAGDAIPGGTPAEPYSAFLSSFRGTNVNGTWLLYVWDDATNDVGTIAGGWCVAISSSNTAPTADAGGPYAVDEGATITLDGSTSSDADGEIASYAWSFGDGATATGPTPQHTYSDNGTYKVTLVVTDDDGATSETATTTVTVSNVAPVVTKVSVPSAPVAVGTPITVSAIFSDVGAGDTHTAVFDLDNGGGTAAGEISGNTAAATVTYSAPGVYTITATVTDDDNGSGSRSSALDMPAYVVVYDPSAGYVTGGGWIVSPAGARVADPMAAGIATFGFVSAYLQGSSTPSGNTEFHFDAGSLRFTSTSYAWLVVAGNKAKYKGEGTINGAGRYGFMLTAIDGGPIGTSDAFRIKIWDLRSGDVVYDNKLGASDDSDASTSLGGGSIVVHR